MGGQAGDGVDGDGLAQAAGAGPGLSGDGDDRGGVREYNSLRDRDDVITGRDPGRGAQTVAAIEAEGGRAEYIVADLSDIASVRRLAEQAGEVDVLVNNAAAHHYAPTLEQDVDSFDMTFDVTVRAPFFLTATLLPKMLARGSGVIVNISGALASSGAAIARKPPTDSATTNCG